MHISFNASICLYSKTSLERDHCHRLSWSTTYSWQKVPNLGIIEPVTKGHLSWETIFLWPMAQSFKTGPTVGVLVLHDTTVFLYHRTWSCYQYVNITPLIMSEYFDKLGSHNLAPKHLSPCPYHLSTHLQEFMPQAIIHLTHIGHLLSYSMWY